MSQIRMSFLSLAYSAIAGRTRTARPIYASAIVEDSSPARREVLAKQIGAAQKLQMQMLLLIGTISLAILLLAARQVLSSSSPDFQARHYHSALAEAEHLKKIQARLQAQHKAVEAFIADMHAADEIEGAARQKAAALCDKCTGATHKDEYEFVREMRILQLIGWASVLELDPVDWVDLKVASRALNGALDPDDASWGDRPHEPRRPIVERQAHAARYVDRAPPAHDKHYYSLIDRIRATGKVDDETVFDEIRLSRLRNALQQIGYYCEKRGLGACDRATVEAALVEDFKTPASFKTPLFEAAFEARYLLLILPWPLLPLLIFTSSLQTRLLGLHRRARAAGLPPEDIWHAFDTFSYAEAGAKLYRWPQRTALRLVHLLPMLLYELPLITLVGTLPVVNHIYWSPAPLDQIAAGYQKTYAPTILLGLVVIFCVYLYSNQLALRPIAKKDAYDDLPPG